MHEDSEVIAIFLDGGTDPADAGAIDFSATTCLLRDAAGGVSIEPTTADHVQQIAAENSGVFRRGKPIVEPVTGEIIGYELEEDEHLHLAAG